MFGFVCHLNGQNIQQIMLHAHAKNKSKWKTKRERKRHGEGKHKQTTLAALKLTVKSF